MNKATFFDGIRGGFTGKIEPDEVRGTEAVLAAMAGSPVSWTAYALATAWHETAGTMQPVREAYWLSEDWRRRNLRYFPHYGRGYVQLTWAENYAKADRELGLGGQLIANLDLAMRADIAARILRRGMEEGWFSGDRKGRHKFSRHLPASGAATHEQFRQARRIINLMDKAETIASYAVVYQRALMTAGWA
jgi:putative chitinase